MGKLYSNTLTLQSSDTDGSGTVMPVAGLSVVGLQVSGSFTATVTFQGTVDMSNWIAVQAANLNNGAVGSTATAAGLFSLPVAGLSAIRAVISSHSTGTVTVKAIGTVAAAGMTLADIDIAGTETVTVGTLPSSIQGAGNPTVDSYNTALINAAAAADQALVATPGANKQIWVYGLYMMADTGAGTVTLQDSDNTALSGTMAVSDEGGWVLPISGNFAMPWLKVTTNKALEADCATCTIDGIITYAVVSV